MAVVYKALDVWACDSSYTKQTFLGKMVYTFVTQIGSSYIPSGWIDPSRVRGILVVDLSDAGINSVMVSTHFDSRSTDIPQYTETFNAVVNPSNITGLTPINYSDNRYFLIEAANGNYATIAGADWSSSWTAHFADGSPSTQIQLYMAGNNSIGFTSLSGWDGGDFTSTLNAYAYTITSDYRPSRAQLVRTSVLWNESVVKWWNGVTPPVPEDTDPFSPGGSTEPGGGGGDFDDPSEDVTDPAVPDISAVDTGFITLFNPTISQLNSLASYMWSAGFDLETFKKIFANPMDCILGLSILPKIVPAGGSRAVMVGNISTGVSMTVAASQFVKFDCGSVNVKRYSNSFLDYAPYTKVSIYLPFIGIHELSVDDVMNKSVQVKYNIDILSGACAAFVICGGTTLYTYTGQCAASVPVTSGDWSTMINGVIGAVGGAVKAAIGGIGGLASSAGKGIARGAASLASSAMDVAGMKPSIEHSGNMGGMGGLMGVKTPFLIITRPQQAIPGQQNKYTGYPAFITKKLDDLEGYTEIEEIHLENIPATENEITEIYDILKSGVIL